MLEWSIPREPPLLSHLFSPPVATLEAPYRSFGRLQDQPNASEVSSGLLTIGFLRLRISNSSAWRCGADPKGMPTSAPSCLSKITTYVRSKSFHFDGSQSRVDQTRSGSIRSGRRGRGVNEFSEPPELLPFVSCILSLCLKDHRWHAGYTFHER
jgi:hypothetical protein